MPISSDLCWFGEDPQNWNQNKNLDESTNTSLLEPDQMVIAYMLFIIN